MSALREEVRAIVTDILGLSNDTSVDAVRLGEYPDWDSMRHMQILLALETHFGVRLPTYVIPQLTDVDSIAGTIAQYQDRKSTG